MTESRALLESERFRRAKAELLAAIEESSRKVRAIRPGEGGAVREQYEAALKSFTRVRGRDLYYPFLSSGLGCGPYVELADGSVKLDLISGIGISFFGHTHAALAAEVIDAAPADIMQGNLQPGQEAATLLEALLARVGPGSRLKHGWLMCSGTMVNEVALKIIRQKKAPATRVLAFEDCFSGRSTAMQEITDNPGYRQGQPVYGEASHLPFYSPKLGLEASVSRTLERMAWWTSRFPGKHAALMIELVQGEGGFNFAPREWYLRVFDQAKAAGMAIWADEIQTFGRTGELFAYQTLGLAEHVDVVTIGKMLHACAALYTEEYNPKPGLLAGTFSGSAVALRAGTRTLKLLDEGGYFGPQGRINALSRRFTDGLAKLATGACAGKLSDIRALGGMIAFQPHGGKMEEVKSVLMRLFDLGVVAFYCGHGPYLVRLLPPLGGMTEADVDDAVALIGKALA